MRPFLKWAGGKSQILEDIISRFPLNILETRKISRYIEPFIGGGALFFYLMTKFDVEESVIIDKNSDLILTYNTIKFESNNLLEKLNEFKKTYIALGNEERAEYYLKLRDDFNIIKFSLRGKRNIKSSVELAARLIFLNKTCFNGLYRVNSKGEFNVPHGRYKNPKIFDKANIMAISRALQNTEILCSDYQILEKYADNKTLIYYDPPYRPINKTSSFNSYNSMKFDDNEQRRLADFYKYMDSKGPYQILSNSDPKNEDVDDDFFELNYPDYYIDRIFANRVINCNGLKRGKITELLIKNY